MTEPRHLNRILQSATLRLTGTYLAIIMLMSITFSFVFYNTSSHQLDRQALPQDVARVYESIRADNQRFTPSEIQRFLSERADEGRHELIAKLVLLNAVVFVLGGALSYVLARRSLLPIEEAMELQTRFVSDASHELRTPLTALQTTNEVALRKTTLNTAEARELIEHNVEEVIKLKTLSDGLLGLLKQDGMVDEPTSVSLQAVANESMNRIAPSAIKKHMSVNDTVPNIMVKSSEPSLVQVVTILLDNAVKYSPERSEIFIDAKARSKTATLTVRDQGIGIKATELPHIYERFYRADTSRSRHAAEGHGLGLSIARRLTDQLGIEISVESTQGKGTTFTLKIPIA